MWSMVICQDKDCSISFGTLGQQPLIWPPLRSPSLCQIAVYLGTSQLVQDLDMNMLLQKSTRRSRLIIVHKAHAPCNLHVLFWDMHSHTPYYRNIIPGSKAAASFFYGRLYAALRLIARPLHTSCRRFGTSCSWTMPTTHCPSPWLRTVSAVLQAQLIVS